VPDQNYNHCKEEEGKVQMKEWNNQLHTVTKEDGGEVCSQKKAKTPNRKTTRERKGERKLMSGSGQAEKERMKIHLKRTGGVPGACTQA